jgi:RecJ-like exonuclease
VRDDDEYSQPAGHKHAWPTCTKPFDDSHEQLAEAVEPVPIVTIKGSGHDTHEVRSDVALNVLAAQSMQKPDVAE